ATLLNRKRPKLLAVSLASGTAKAEPKVRRFFCRREDNTSTAKIRQVDFRRIFWVSPAVLSHLSRPFCHWFRPQLIKAWVVQPQAVHDLVVIVTGRFRARVGKRRCVRPFEVNDAAPFLVE